MNLIRNGPFLVVLLVLGCSSSNNLERASYQVIQMGSITVPQVSRPTNDPWTLVYQVNVPFTKQFRQAPKVFLSLSKIEAYSRRSGTFYQLVADDISSTGFQLQIFGAYMDSFSNCTITWTAIAQD
jgi:hypothetical protein